MAQNHKAVFGLVKNVRQAEQIVNELLIAGFAKVDISILYASPETGEAQFAGGFEGRYQNENIRSRKAGGLGHEKHSKAPEGAAIGGTAGGLIGGTLGLLAGIGALAIPGMGPFIAAGPILGALAGSGIGGGIGLLTGALLGLGIPEYEAVHYAEMLKDQQHVLISVHTNSYEDLDKARKVLEANGAKDISYEREIAAPRSSKW